MDPQFLKMLNNTLDKSTFDGAVAEMNSRPTTLVHGDFQASNVFLDEFEQKIFMIDFSEVGVGDPFSDLVQYVISDIPPHQRHCYEMKVLEAYWTRLTSTGVDAAEFPFTRCVELYKTAIDRWLWTFPIMAMFDYKPVYVHAEIGASVLVCLVLRALCGAIVLHVVVFIARLTMVVAVGLCQRPVWPVALAVARRRRRA